MSKLRPKKRIEILNQVQEEAVGAVKQNNYIGTIKLPTGLGNIFV